MTSTHQRLSVEDSRFAVTYPTLRALRITDPTHGRWVLGPALVGPPALVRTSVPALVSMLLGVFGVVADTVSCWCRRIAPTPSLFVLLLTRLHLLTLPRSGWHFDTS